MSEVLIPELQLYEFAVIVLSVAVLAFVGWTIRLPAKLRSYGIAGTAILAFMALGYILMATETLTVVHADGETPLGRYVGYAVLFSIVYLLLWAIAGGKRRWAGALLFANFLWLGSVATLWLIEGPAELAAIGGNFVAFFIILFVLLGPLKRATGDVSPERRLLYGKLTNLLLLVLVLYLVMGFTADHALGLFDTFVGVFTGIYVDLLFVITFCTILLRGTTALEQVVDASRSETTATDDTDGVTVGTAD